MIDPRHLWNFIYNARSHRDVCPTSPNIAPATKSNTHHWSSSHMKRYLQCAEQQKSASNFTKYCACHEKWISWLILVTNETLFTMRGATCVIVQTHQILRLPRKITVQNVRKQMKRHLQCAADPRPFREWSEHDPSMKPSVRNPPRDRGYFSRSPRAFCIEKYKHFALRLSFQISRNTAPATKSNSATSRNTAPATKYDSHDQSSSHIKNYLQWALPKLSYDLTELWLNWAMTWLSYDLTELWLDRAMTWLSFD